MENYLIFIVLIPIVVILLLIILVAIKISRNQISRNKIFKELGEKEVDQARRLIFLEAFGGSENIISVNREMSRISVNVKELEKVDLDQLKTLGATGVLVVGSEVKCSFNNLAEEVYNLIK